jgi:hypothetical protein
VDAKGSSTESSFDLSVHNSDSQRSSACPSRQSKIQPDLLSCSLHEEPKLPAIERKSTLAILVNDIGVATELEPPNESRTLPSTPIVAEKQSATPPPASTIDMATTSTGVRSVLKQTSFAATNDAASDVQACLKRVLVKFPAVCPVPTGDSPLSQPLCTELVSDATVPDLYKETISRNDLLTSPTAVNIVDTLHETGPLQTTTFSVLQRKTSLQNLIDGIEATGDCLITNQPAHQDDSEFDF